VVSSWAVKSGQRIEDWAPVRAHCNGEPVYAFGFTYVYSVSPDFDPGRILQEGNRHPWQRIRPRKSWEIGHSRIGSTPAREPRTAAAVRIVPHPKGWRVHNPTLRGWEHSEPRIGQALPERLEVRVSADAKHWDIVFASEDFSTGPAGEPRTARFQPRAVKQVLVAGRRLPWVLNLGCCFSISSIEVLDESGTNLALLSRGAGVDVSSTNTGFGMDRWTQEMLWPIQYDVGYKWARVGYDMGSFLWSQVERERGVLAVDPRADQAVTEAVENGVHIIMCLDKGNWLYAPVPKRLDPTRDIVDTYFNRPPEPTVSAEAMEGYLRYVRFMVRHFRNRVRYYEIMNEWYDLVGTPEEYVGLLRRAVPVIREEQPEARIVLGSASNPNWGDFILPCLELGAGTLVDAIGWHGLGSIEEVAVGSFSADRDGVGVGEFRPHSDIGRDGIESGVRSFAEKFNDLRNIAESRGFKGEYLMTEFAFTTSYPPVWGGNAPSMPLTELDKARYAAQAIVMAVGLDITCLWNETFQTQANRGISLLRNTVSADPLPPVQPETIYYVQRTLCTLLGDVRPEALPVSVVPEPRGIQVWGFATAGGGRLAALWANRGAASQPAPREVVDLVIRNAGVTRVAGIDVLNGREQELAVTRERDRTVIRGIVLDDFPVMIRFS
jgi:hypothetical protein